MSKNEEFGESILVKLPPTLRAWRDIDPFRDDDWFRPWKILRPYFLQKGYDLFRPQSGGLLSIANNGPPSPAEDSFSLYGDRGNGFESRFRRFALVFAARDSMNRDVVIKLVSKGNEGSRELEILRFLHSEPLRSDSSNATVPVIEFLDYCDCHFVVMPFYGGCDESPFLNAYECLDFSEQVLTGLTFLHWHRIAHLDISYENILMNHHGIVPKKYEITPEGVPVRLVPPPEFRSTFPVRYYLMDFGFSHRYSSDSCLSKCIVGPFKNGREHAAPEASQAEKPFNPFSADVYQIARLLYAWFKDVVHEVPGFLELLQDMSSYNPSNRITSTEALQRFLVIRNTVPDEQLHRTLDIDLLYFPLIPRSLLRMLYEIIQTGQLILASRFVWYSFRNCKFGVTKTEEQ